jgi:hypothetical protein
MTNETPTALEDFHEMLAIYAKAIEEHFAIQAANAIHPVPQIALLTADLNRANARDNLKRLVRRMAGAQQPTPEFERFQVALEAPMNMAIDALAAGEKA